MPKKATRRSRVALHPAPPPPPPPQAVEASEMKVDSPSYLNKGMQMQYQQDKDVDVAVSSTEDDVDVDDDHDIADDADQDDQEPPYKRLRTGRDSALFVALKDLSKTSFARPVVVRVGSLTNSEDFHIHEQRLASSSPFFEAAFKKHYKDGGSGDPLELPDDDPVVFQLYAHYIYDKCSIRDLSLSTDMRHTVYDTYLDLLQAYIFGEKVQNSGFQNEVMNRILKCMRDMHNPPAGQKPAPTEHIVRPLIELLYPSLPPDAIGRGLAVETFIVLWSHSDKLQTFVPDLSRELLTEIAEMLLSGDKDHIRDAWAQAINGDYSYYHSARSDEH